MGPYTVPATVSFWAGGARMVPLVWQTMTTAAQPNQLQPDRLQLDLFSALDARGAGSSDNVRPSNQGTLRIELKRGTPRRRRVEGVLQGGTLVVSFPARMTKAEVWPIAEELRLRMERRVARDRIDLAARTRKLAREYGLPKPRSVEWSDRQRGRWGSCTPVDGSIRISNRLSEYPLWVLDYVLIHELAHLVHADHSPRFHALVAKYPKSERAIGFLIAKSSDGSPDGCSDECSDQ